MDMDRNRISLSEEYEMRYWTQALGVSEEELLDAVREVGHSAAAVREHLRTRKRRQL
jgi:hypothetical protein